MITGKGNYIGRKGQAMNTRTESQFVTKVGKCGVANCTQAHVVEPVSIWDGVTQYRGTHHDDTFIYERWMVTSTLELSPAAEQRLATWAAMDSIRLSADNWDSFTTEYAMVKSAVRIDGPLFTCDQCGGQGYIANSWDSSSAFHPCYRCSTTGSVTVPEWVIRKSVCEEALANMQDTRADVAAMSDDEYSRYMDARDEYMTGA